MKDFLIMLYLAFTLFCTIVTAGSTIYDSRYSKQTYTNTIYFIWTTTSILWSIWYVYIIH